MNTLSLKQTVLSFFALFAVFFASLFMSPALANAQLFSGAADEACQGTALNSGSGGSNACNPGNEDDLSDLIQNIINIISVIIGIIAVIMIIINGARFIVSRGDSQAISSARNGVIYALVGLVLVASAQLIVRVVLSNT